MQDTTTAQTTTSWMWAGGENVAGVRLDKERGELRWQNEIGCHCAGDDAVVQTAVSYLTDGLPAGIPAPPLDVTAELESALRRLMTS